MEKYDIPDDFNSIHEVLASDSEESFILPKVALNIHQNILSYFPDQVEEITVDEKKQSGKGKTRDILQ